MQVFFSHSPQAGRTERVKSHRTKPAEKIAHSDFVVAEKLRAEKLRASLSRAANLLAQNLRASVPHLHAEKLRCAKLARKFSAGTAGLTYLDIIAGFLENVAKGIKCDLI